MEGTRNPQSVEDLRSFAFGEGGLLAFKYARSGWRGHANSPSRATGMGISHSSLVVTVCELSLLRSQNSYLNRRGPCTPQRFFISPTGLKTDPIDIERWVLVCEYIHPIRS